MTVILTTYLVLFVLVKHIRKLPGISMLVCPVIISEPVSMFSCSPSFFYPLIFSGYLLVFLSVSFQLVSTSLQPLEWKLGAFYKHVQFIIVTFFYLLLGIEKRSWFWCLTFYWRWGYARRCAVICEDIWSGRCQSCSR